MGNDQQFELFGQATPPEAVEIPEEPKGRAKGGVARAEKLTAEERADIARKAALARWSAPAPAEALTNDRELTVIEYTGDDNSSPVPLGFDAHYQGIWATQDQIAELFKVAQSQVSRHLRNVFDEGELAAEINMRKTHIDRSKKPVTLYSLDAIISVGYRVNSRAATRFRQWATQTLRTYVEQGYVLNEKVLREHPDKLNKLASDVRRLRTSERSIYAKVRECFKVAATDYQPSSQEVRTFYALLQDKFHHAVTHMTSSKLILDRADHTDDNMGLQSMEGDKPTKSDAKIGKNYLRTEELYRLHLLCEQFLLFAKSTALAGREMTMASLHEQLDRLLVLNNYPVFDGYQDYIREEAVRHAEQEWGLYQKRLQLEDAGVFYDPLVRISEQTPFPELDDDYD